MSNWSISRRILANSVLILGLLAVLGVISYTAATSIGGTFNDYRQTARQANSLNALIEDLFEARMASLKYRFSGSDEDAGEVRGNIEEIFNDNEKLSALLANRSDVADLLTAEKEDLRKYLVAFEQTVTLQAQRNEIVDRFAAEGKATREALTSIMETAYRDGDAEAALYAGIAQQELLLGRLYAERFLLDNTTASFDTAMANFSEAADQMTTLLEQLENPERRALAMTAVENLDGLKEDLQSVSTVIAERNELRTDVLDVLGPEMQHFAEQILDAVVADQDRLGPAGTAKAAATQREVLTLSAVALLIGLATAIVIGRWTTGTVKGVATKMEQLAEGDLTIEVTGTKVQNELGQMARALEVFRENAVRVESLAVEKKEADERAAAQREEMMENLRTSFGSAVEKAVEGDFSARVSADFDDDTLNDLAQGLNRLMTSVQDGVDETQRVMERLADGALNERMRGNFQGAFASLQSNVNDTVHRLSEVVTSIATASAAVQRESENITRGARDLSVRAGQQAASLEETSATMEEMTASTKANADNAVEASRFAGSASDQADQAAEIVDQTVTKMNEIESGASEISGIVTVIDSIAFQTNLLALNAAVEAARAGEAGKGFAVVASEVRSLAQRSSEAARDIRNLISKSEEQVSSGVNLVEQMGKSLNTILQAIREVSATMQSITEASQEQAAGLNDITSSIANIDNITQENASMADMSASSAQNLVDRAQALRELVAVFQLEGQSSAEKAA